MVLRPQNNIYGAYVMAWDQYEIEKSAAAKAAAAEAQAGKRIFKRKEMYRRGIVQDSKLVETAERVLKHVKTLPVLNMKL